MQSIGEAKAAAAADSIVLALSRLTVLRPLAAQAPFQALYRLALALREGALEQALVEYHTLCGALIGENCRAVSGDIFTDYLLYALLEQENDFSRRALENRWNDAVSAAMANDLEQLQRLSGVTSALIKKWVGERREELLRQAPPMAQRQDDIAKLSAAVWSGSAAQPIKKQTVSQPVKPKPPEPQPPRAAVALEEASWPTFRYQHTGLEGEYVSDIALEEIYRRLLEAKDWSRLLDDIWNFHAAYGTGAFIRHRAFSLLPSGALVGVEPMPRFGEGPRMYEAQRGRILSAVIAFMQGEGAGDILVTGGTGTGKTAGAIDLYYELPELRLVMASDPEPEALTLAVEAVSRQPARVLLLLDDVEAGSGRLRRQMSAITERRGSNLMVMAASRAGFDPAFSNTVRFLDMQPREFMQLLRQLLQKGGMTPTEDMLQNACIDCGAQKRTLCCGTAEAVARELLEGE